ncbi:hypothetical protein GGI12_002498 [Dipsacomyces acuminosporus]|nr:hypothetical protein GGI12_002498 [Dipsacomyces acuminosporus]
MNDDQISLSRIDELFVKTTDTAATATTSTRTSLEQQRNDLRLSLRLSAGSTTFASFNIDDFNPISTISEQEDEDEDEDDLKASPKDSLQPGSPSSSSLEEGEGEAIAGDQEMDDTTPTTLQEEGQEQEKPAGDKDAIGEDLDKPTKDENGESNPKDANSNNKKADDEKSDDDDNPVKARLRSLRSRRLASSNNSHSNARQHVTRSMSGASSNRNTNNKNSSGGGGGGGSKPLSKMGPLQLDRLTKLNTRRNSTYLTCKIEKYTVTMESERPPSPTTLMQMRAQERKLLRCNLSNNEGDDNSMQSIEEDGEDDEDSDSDSEYYWGSSDDEDAAQGIVLNDEELKLVDPNAAINTSSRPLKDVDISQLVESRPISPIDDYDVEQDGLLDTQASGSGVLVGGFQNTEPMHGVVTDNAEQPSSLAQSSDIKRKSIDQIPTPPSTTTTDDTSKASLDSNGSGGGSKTKKLRSSRRIQWGKKSVLQATRLLGKLPKRDTLDDGTEGGYTKKPGKSILSKQKDQDMEAPDTNAKGAGGFAWSSTVAAMGTSRKRLSHASNLKIIRVACLEYPDASEQLDDDDEEDEDAYEDVEDDADDADEYIEEKPPSRRSTRSRRK